MGCIVLIVFYVVFVFNRRFLLDFMNWYWLECVRLCWFQWTSTKYSWNYWSFDVGWNVDLVWGLNAFFVYGIQNVINFFVVFFLLFVLMDCVFFEFWVLQMGLFFFLSGFWVCVYFFCLCVCEFLVCFVWFVFVCVLCVYIYIYILFWFCI